MKKFVIYIRVSTSRQGQSGLGLSAQKDICENYIASVNGMTEAIFKDVESGKSRTRIGLWQAIEHCKKHNTTLVIAKLDRLARDVEFTFKVMNTGIEIHFCDMPVVNSMILGVFASVAQYERELCSSRTKAALHAKKAQGIKLGRPKGCEASGNALRASAISRRNTAKENPNNIAFARYLSLWESRNGTVTAKTSLKELINELNIMQIKTSTGCSFTDPNQKTNESRLWSMIKRVRKIYQEV